MKTKEEAIRAFIAAGYALIPLAGKKPTEENWEHTPHGKHNEKTLAKGNYGVVLGPRDLVLDVDPRNYRAGDDPLARFSKEIGGLPADTLIGKTGGGGLHVYLKKPADLAVRNNLSEYPGLEFKGGPGRQVVGPGSLHPETHDAYYVIKGDASAIAQAPAALLELIKRPPQQDFGTAGAPAFKDDAATTSRCVAYLLGNAPTSGTYKVACHLRDLGVSPLAAFKLLRDVWNPLRAIAKSDEHLAERVRHVYTYARGAAGNAHPDAVFDEAETEKPKTAKKEEPAGPDRGLPTDAEVGKSGWRTDNKNQPVTCFQNTLNYFTLSAVGLRGCFAYDEFARCVQIIKDLPWGGAGRDVQDIDVTRLRAHLARQHGYEAKPPDIIDGMVEVSQRLRFHPVRDYLDGLEWDGKKRLGTWLQSYLGVEEDEEGYVQAVGTKTLAAAVARIYEPGVKFDHVPVLEGKQGLGKSGVCKVLGGPWFSDFKMNAGEKDTVQMMQGKWIVEMADLHVTRQTDLDTLKAFLTRAVDEARFAYGRLPGKYPRQGIFIATYNPGPDGTYLKDEENRRWWPVKCEGVPPGSRTFDFVGLKAVRDQLWAEAAALVKPLLKDKTALERFLTMDTDKLQVAARKQQAERHGEHPWKERIDEWLKERDLNEVTREDFYTGHEVFVGALSGNTLRYARREQLAVAQALRELGWFVGHRRRDGELVRGYWRNGVTVEAKELLGDLV